MAAVDICNSALTLLGQERITTLADNLPQAQLCNAHYDQVRRNLLRAHPWNFASKRVTSTATGATPEYDFTQVHDLPADYIRFLETECSSDKYQIENAEILCYLEELKYKYVYDVEDTDLMPQDFQEALALALAIKLSWKLVQSNTLRAEITGLYREQIAVARSFDGQESPTIHQVVDDLFINSRY